MARKSLLILMLPLAALGCTPYVPTHKQYTPPADSGLNAVRPFPTDGDICQLIGENNLTTDYLDHTSQLIGCPNHEIGAISDLTEQGASMIKDVGAWTLLNLPNKEGV